MMKKVMSLFLVATMVFSLAACGNRNNTETAGTSDNKATEGVLPENSTGHGENGTAAIPDNNMESATGGENGTTNGTTNETTNGTVNGVTNGTVNGTGTTNGTMTVGQTLLEEFHTRLKTDATLGAQELADALVGHQVIAFEGTTTPVEEGLLTGFNNTEVRGFKEGVMFAPSIGTIPFVGYVFTLNDGEDVDAFVKHLKENADPRWNVCTEAEETIVEANGNTVLFIMSPKTLEQ